MTKVNLVNVVADELDMAKKNVTEIVDTVFEVIIAGVNEDGEVSIHQFGKFVKVVKPEHKARNPKTGEEIIVPEHNVVKFKPSASFKDSVAE